MNGFDPPVCTEDLICANWLTVVSYSHAETQQEIIVCNFDVHSTNTASTKSAELLGGAEKAFEFIPNLLGVLVKSPAGLKDYCCCQKTREGFQSGRSSTKKRLIKSIAIRTRVQDGPEKATSTGSNSISAVSCWKPPPHDGF